MADKLIVVGCEVKGIKELELRLRSIGPKLAKKTMRGALRAVGKFWVEDVKGRVPVDTGDLQSSIAGTVRIRRAGKGAIGTVTVGPRFDKKSTNRPGDMSQSPGVYGQFVEFGTDKMAAQPFLRPAFDATADRVIELFAEKMREGLAEVAADGDTSFSEAMDLVEDIGGSGGDGAPSSIPKAIRTAGKLATSGLKRLLDGNN
jgi:HK97 gp10 family phage protein